MQVEHVYLSVDMYSVSILETWPECQSIFGQFCWRNCWPGPRPWPGPMAGPCLGPAPWAQALARARAWAHGSSQAHRRMGPS